jgi:hypothetical protein
MALTLKALNDGTVEDTQGIEKYKIPPISAIKDDLLRSELDGAAVRLKKVGNLVTILQQHDDMAKKAKILEEIDSNRDALIRTLNSVWEFFELDQLPIPTEATDATDVYEQFPLP